MNTQELKDFARSLGADYVGVTAPAGLKVPDKYNWTKSVVMLGVYTLDETIDAILRMQVQDKRKWSKWIYEIIDGKALRLCAFIREQGFKAVYSRGIDLVKAAQQVGFGALGKNRMLITKEVGPRVRLIAVLTDALLEFDKPFSEELCKDCDSCIKACPGGALTETGFDRSKCIGEFDPTPAMVAKQKKMEKRLSEYVRIHCLDCMVACPIGKKLKIEELDVTD